jgi:hypothetical protein
MDDNDEEFIEALIARFATALDEFCQDLAKQRPVAHDGNIAQLRPVGRLDERETEIVLAAFVDVLGAAIQFRADRARWTRFLRGWRRIPGTAGLHGSGPRPAR